MKIRPASSSDHAPILSLVRQLDLAYPGQTLDHFRVAEDKGEIVGIANLEEFPDLFFLSSVGVKPEHQHHGIATRLLNGLLAELRKDVYLYTVIPDFFTRFGFRATAPDSRLPGKTTFSCRECDPATCVTMVRPKR